MSLWDFARTRVPRSEYQVVERIGSGGTAEVFRGLMHLGAASGESIQHAVAIKRLLPHLRTDAYAVEQFIKEARILSTVDHPHVPELIDLRCDDKGIWWMVQEYVPGYPLQYFLEPIRDIDADRSRRDLERVLPAALSVVIDLCDVLDSVHAEGWVHCDVTPGNILITPRGHIKLIDFGVARKIHVLPEREPHGTYAYMSPEHLRGQSVDARSDIFSVGVLLYELATGVRPFAGDHVEIIRSVVERDPVWPSQLRPVFPPALERIILACLKKKPEDRPASMRELAAAAKDFAMSQSILWGSERVAGLYPSTMTSPPKLNETPQATPLPEHPGKQIVPRSIGALWLPKSFRNKQRLGK